MTTWQRISFDGAIAHAVSAELAAQLVDDMLMRGHAVADFSVKYGPGFDQALGGNPKPITEWAFDLGGSCHKDRPVESFDVDGLAIYVPCEQHADILATLGEHWTPRRLFRGGDWYYKVKLWSHATVFTVAQRDLVVRELEERRALAADRARLFKDALDRSARSGVS